MATSNQLPNANPADLDGVMELLATKEDLDWIQAFQSRPDRISKAGAVPVAPAKRQAMAERMRRLSADRKKARGGVGH